MRTIILLSLLLLIINSSNSYIYSHTNTYHGKSTRLYETFQEFLKAKGNVNNKSNTAPSGSGKNYGLSSRLTTKVSSTPVVSSYSSRPTAIASTGKNYGMSARLSQASSKPAAASKPLAWTPAALTKVIIVSSHVLFIIISK